jgi:hypothetical protein
MLCCALIALFAGQPAVLAAAVRARLFPRFAAVAPSSAPLWRNRAAALAITIAMEGVVLGASGTFGYLALSQSDLPYGVARICSVFRAGP